MTTRSPRRKRPEPASSSAKASKPESAAAPSSAPPMNASKAKRTLTPDNFFKTVANVMASGPVLLEALVRPRLSPALREKLFLAVTSVNDCRYCKWGHTHWALAQGVPLEEVNQILGHQIASLEAKNPAEAAAILFAQHYAEQLDQFAPEAIENLGKHYSEAEVAEILAYVRFITLANLTGNTVDAILDRCPGDGNTSSLSEGIVAAAAVPVALLLTQLAKFDMDKLRCGPLEDASPKADAGSGGNRAR